MPITTIIIASDAVPRVLSLSPPLGVWRGGTAVTVGGVDFFGEWAAPVVCVLFLCASFDLGFFVLLFLVRSSCQEVGILTRDTHFACWLSAAENATTIATTTTTTILTETTTGLATATEIDFAAAALSNPTAAAAAVGGALGVVADGVGIVVDRDSVTVANATAAAVAVPTPPWVATAAAAAAVPFSESLLPQAVCRFSPARVVKVCFVSLHCIALHCIACELVVFFVINRFSVLLGLL